MNRYQFEDSISAYLDNDLSISDRKLFEEYMNKNIDAKNLVDDIRSTLKSTKNFSNIKASKDFMPNLFKRIQFEKNRPVKKIIEKPSKSLFGFTPLYATLMSILVISFISIGINMWPQSILMDNSASAFTGDINPPNLNIKDINIKSQPQVLVSKEAKSDSSDTTIINKKNFRLNSKVQLVKDQK
jgi:hypothetical protein